MSTQQFVVPTSTAQIVTAGDNTDFVAVAGATGSITLDVSTDGINWFGGQTATLGGAVSLNTKTLGLGAFAKIRATAGIVSGALFACDITAPFRSGGNQSPIIAQTSIATVAPAVTTLVPMFAMRFPAGYFKPNFSIEVEILALTTGAGTKAFSFSFGNTGVATLGQAAQGIAAGSGRASARFIGRNDGQTVLFSGLGSAGGWGTNATVGNVISSNASYLTQEQELVIGVTKSAGADTAQIDSVLVKLYQ